MGKLNIEFMDDALGFYSKTEDDIETKIKNQIIDGNKKKYKEMDTDEFTFLSPQRAKLFEWFDFNQNAKLLEIGSELGALTSFFAKHVKHVTVIEKKESRVDIIKERFKDFKNIEVIHDNFSSLSYMHEFDYIIVHDIVGYIKKYIHSENPYDHFLNILNTYLKNDGTIMIAIENRLGLKYFSGSIEEYSYKFYTGLNNFDGYDSIKTLSKVEWEQFINQSGLGFKYQFLYPFPDCMFPYEIQSESSLKKFYYGADYQDISSAKFNFFSEQEVFRSLKKEGVVDKFANAFLIELTKKDLSPLFYFSSNNYKTKITNNENKFFVQHQFYSTQPINHVIDSNNFERIDDLLIDLSDFCLLSNIKSNRYINEFYEKIEFIVKDIQDRFDTKYAKINYSDEFKRIFGQDKITEEVLITKSISFHTTFKDVFYDYNTQSVYLPCFKNNIDIPVKFYFWKLFYQWFECNIFQSKSKSAKIKFNEINRILEVNPDEEKIYKTWYNSYKEFFSNDVEAHMKPIYNKKFVSEIDVAIYGEQNLDSLDNIDEQTDNSLSKLLSDDKLLDKIRK